MKVNPFRPLIVLALLIVVASTGCIPTLTAVSTATAQPPSPTPVPPTEIPTNTPPPTATATATLPPTLTPTITPTPGPIVVNDDFSTDTGRFTCDLCVVKDGELFMGPYPSIDSFEAYYALCNDCGSPTNYDMAFDARFVSGASDRGFGAIIRENEGSFIDLEITTWLVYGVWHYNAELSKSAYAWDDSYTWGWVQTSLKGGTQTNHVEIIMRDGTMSVKINGKTSIVTVPKGSGRVGLVVGMHSLGVAFDNFRFEEKP